MKKFIILSIISLLVGCTLNHERKNRSLVKSDKVLKLEKQIEDFYTRIRFDFKNKNLVFPSEIDTVYSDQQFITVNYEEESTDSLKNRLTSDIISKISTDSSRSVNSIIFNVSDKTAPSLYEINYNYSSGSILKFTILKGDSLVNNVTDSLSCVVLTRNYYQNGKLKSVGCGTNHYTSTFGGAPVGKHTYYDSLGNITKTVFYHINEPDEAYKIVAEFNKNGEIISKIKTRNDHLYDVLADTLEIMEK